MHYVLWIWLWCIIDMNLTGSFNKYSPCLFLKMSAKMMCKMLQYCIRLLICLQLKVSMEMDYENLCPLWSVMLSVVSRGHYIGSKVVPICDTCVASVCETSCSYFLLPFYRHVVIMVSHLHVKHITLCVV